MPTQSGLAMEWRCCFPHGSKLCEFRHPQRRFSNSLFESLFKGWRTVFWLRSTESASKRLFERFAQPSKIFVWGARCAYLNHPVASRCVLDTTIQLQKLPRFMAPKRRVWNVETYSVKTFWKHFRGTFSPNRVVWSMKRASKMSWLNMFRRLCSPNEDFGTSKKWVSKTVCKHF